MHIHQGVRVPAMHVASREIDPENFAQTHHRQYRQQNLHSLNWRGTSFVVPSLAPDLDAKRE